MKVTITSNTLDAGGAERQRVQLANGLSERGFDVRLALIQSHGPLRPTVAPGVKVSLGWRAADDVSRGEAVVTGTTNTECAWAMRAFRLRRSRLQGWLMAIHNPTGPGAPAPKPFVRYAAQHLTGKVIGLSPSHCAWARDEWRMPARDYIGNGTELGRYTEVARYRSTNPSYTYDFAYLGRLSLQHKGLDTLLAALRAVPGRLAIAGDGPDAGRLAKLARDLGVADRIDWLGYSDPRTVFRSARVLVLPSRYEGQPMVLLEAAAAGVPVITTRVGGAEAFVPPSQLVDTGDAAALSHAMARGEQSTAGNCLRDSAMMVSEYAALLEEMLGHRR
ncbi:MAG: glycosyltransferase [Actinomycetota bacterium]|nr:glycosyltransferase [Actinomycetota bacterium]